MDNIGYLIKSERKKLQMKQVNLARGICSTSYLSKIENNATDASEEVLLLLLERLDLDFKNLYSNEKSDETLLIELNDIYKEVTIHRDKDYAKEKLEYVQNVKGAYNNETFFHINLIGLRLSLFFDEKQKTRFFLDILEDEMRHFSPYQLYLLKKNQGIYLYQCNDIENAIFLFKEARTLLKNTFIEEWEKADLNYMISLSYLADDRIIESITFAKKALRYFKDKLLLHRIVDCHLVLGIAFKRGYQYKDAVEIFQLTIKICDQLHIEDYYGMIYHNLGSLYFHQDKESSIHYFIKSLSYKKQANDQLITILAIIETCAEANEWETVKTWLSKGKSILKQSNIDKAYVQHFIIYEELGSKENLSEKIALPVISYFESVRDYKSCCKYSKLLGDSLFKNKQYKLSAIYYQKTHSYFSKNIRINFREEF